MGLSALHLRGHHVTIHPGHLVVEDHRVHRMREEQPQSSVPTLAPRVTSCISKQQLALAGFKIRGNKARDATKTHICLRGSIKSEPAGRSEHNFAHPI